MIITIVILTLIRQILKIIKRIHNQLGIETEIGRFATNIIDKTENRQSNIRLTCSKLNNLEINAGDTFSFLNTLGETSEKTRI